MRFLGLDYGSKTIGVSVSSPSNKVATGITTLTRPMEAGLRPNLKELKAIIKEYNITHIVLGNPLHLSGRDSERCQKTAEFKEKLNRYFKTIPVELWDERLSTAAVTRTFEGTKAQYEKHVDEMAAVYILQGFLDRREKEMEDKQLTQDEDNMIVLHDDEGNEIALEILASRKANEATYALAVDSEDEEDGDVLILKCIEEDEDVVFEIVDDEHEEFDQVFELFKEDFATLGIEITDIEL